LISNGSEQFDNVPALEKRLQPNTRSPARFRRDGGYTSVGLSRFAQGVLCYRGKYSLVFAFTPTFDGHGVLCWQQTVFGKIGFPAMGTFLLIFIRDP